MRAFTIDFILSLTFSLIFVACGPRSSQDSQFSLLNASTDGEIVGGTEVKAKSPESAFVVMIYGESQDGKPFVCTGSFISDSVVLTAAHCVVDDISKLTLAFSVNPLNDTEVLTLPIKSVFRHENYKKETTATTDRNDIALIKFTGGLPVGARKVDLPVVKENVQISATNLLALGYGRTEGRDDSTDADTEIGILRAVRISVEKIDLQANSFIASQKNKKGVCSGDSGGPLLDTKTDSTVTKYTLVGISSGIFDAAKGDTSDSCNQNSIFMNVQFYLPWIQKNLY